MKNISTFRCVICNKVSDPSIETNAHEVAKGEFYRDTLRSMTVCRECQGVHEDLMSEFYCEDEYGKNW